MANSTDFGAGEDTRGFVSPSQRRQGQGGPRTGQTVSFEEVAAMIVKQRPDLTGMLTIPQVRVVELLMAGLTEPEIAERLGRSKHTVHDHTKRIYAAFQVSTRVQLLLLFAAPITMNPDRATGGSAKN
jgi:DNA-binding NarL/FixJ family response regulator